MGLIAGKKVHFKVGKSIKTGILIRHENLPLTNHLDQRLSVKYYKASQHNALSWSIKVNRVLGTWLDVKRKEPLFCM